MNRKFWYLCVSAVMALSLHAAPYSKSEYQIRPWEIINGLQPYSQAIWQADNGDIKKWRASNGGVLSESSLTKLWGEKVAKLTFPRGGSVTITPPQPLVIKEKAYGVELYMYGPLNGKVGAVPVTSLDICDKNNRRIRLTLTGSGSRWASKRWWGAAAGILPENLAYPIKIRSIRFDKLTTRVKNDFLCFDHIGAFQKTPREITDSSKTANPFPLTADGIMPIGMADGAKNLARQVGSAYVFEYQGKDARIAYTYTPASGTLSDISVDFNGKKFRPAVDGGILATVKNVSFLPSDKAIKAQLLKQEFKNNKLSTLWRWTKNNAAFEFELNLSIKGKSLAIEVKALSQDGYAFDCGKTENTPDPRLIQLTYLNNRWNYPQILVTNDYFVSVFLDWFYSDASELMDSPRRRRNVDGIQIYSKTSAKILGGSNYNNLTNGKRNPVYEKMYITVSGELHDVMPRINNPKSKRIEQTGNMVCATRAYPIQGSPKHAQEEIAMWQKFYDYGATDMFVRFHYGVQRTPIESNNISMFLSSAYQNGGDQVVTDLFNGMRKLHKTVGVYNDNRVIHPFAGKDYFSYSGLMRNSNGTFVMGWDGIFRPKSGIQVAMHKHYIAALLKKYPAINGQYLDELSNAPPWADVDYDADTPGAGKFATTLRDYSLLAWNLSQYLNGPIWSEGCASYFWAGVLDLNYAVSNDSKAQLPLIVDYKLMYMNPLSNYTGADWPVLRSSNVDRLIANEIACGNIGHFSMSKENSMPWQGRAVMLKNYEKPLKSYFMIRQVQEYFTGQAPKSIKYFVNGKLMSASEMLKGNHKPSNKICTVYPNGLQTWVNYNADSDWTVTADGKKYILPPYGHVAVVPGKLLQYTARINNAVVDYSRGKHYTFLDGRGKTASFPEMTAAYAYVIRKINGTTRITPAPFVKAETIKDLPFTKAVPLKQNGTPQGAEIKLNADKNGKKSLTTDGRAFHYTVK